MLTTTILLYKIIIIFLGEKTIKKEDIFIWTDQELS